MYVIARTALADVWVVRRGRIIAGRHPPTPRTDPLFEKNSSATQRNNILARFVSSVNGVMPPRPVRVDISADGHFFGHASVFIDGKIERRRKRTWSRKCLMNKIWRNRNRRFHVRFSVLYTMQSHSSVWEPIYLPRMSRGVTCFR